MMNMNWTNKYKLYLLLPLLFFNLSDVQKAQDDVKVLRLGYSNLVFVDIDPRDGNAALIIYAKQMVKRYYERYGKRIKLDTQIFNSFEETKDALKNDKVDLLALPSDQYFELKNDYDLSAGLVTYSGKQKLVEYILITPTKKNFTKVADLRKSTFAFANVSKGWLNEKWIRVLVAKATNESLENFFDQIKYVDKETNAIYDVYFNKADCAVVRKTVFNTLCEFNPHIGKSISILAISQPVIPNILAFKRNLNQEFVKKLMTEASELHLSPEGRRILEIFKTNRTVAVTDEELVTAKAIWEEYNRLMKKIKK